MFPEFSFNRNYKLIQGALLIVLGVVILLKPELILITFAFLAAAILIVIGLLNIFSVLRSR